MAKNPKAIGVLLVALGLLLVIGCGEEQVTGKVTATLQDSWVPSGSNTSLTVNGENTGDIAGDLRLDAVSEEPGKLQVLYDGRDTFHLEPEETTGKKKFTLHGQCDISECTYEVNATLVRQADGVVLDKQVKEIRVTS